MKGTLTLLTGVFLGIMVVTLFQQLRSGVCSTPLIKLVPGMAQFCVDTQGPIAERPPNPTPVPTAAPTVAPPPPPKVDKAMIKAVHKPIYAELIASAEISREEPANWVGPWVVAWRRVTIDGYGGCQAGIDYDVEPADIEQSGASVRVILPRPQVFPCGMTKLKYSSEGPGNPSKDVTNQLFYDAYQAIQRQADEGALLRVARNNAVKEVELNTRRISGIEHVTVEFEEDAVAGDL